jgi:hypothetical protein
MDRIPPLAWVAIAIIVIFTLAINLSLIAMLRAKKPPRLPMGQARPGGFIGAAQDMAKMGKVLRDPFAKERGQLNELSRLVRGLDIESPSNPDVVNKDTNENTTTQAK